MINLEDFKKMELKVATIKEVDEHPDADKLYVVKVSLEGEERQVVAGIKPYYSKEELIGKQVVVVVNLESATIRGVESKGMILAARDEEGIAVLTIDRMITDGSKIS
ncbi:MAG: methionine--tRNA ligase subunit beta [Candidatus Saelkia tenebricola]|nr:methionine--tRNA ligase subunit beta [Candidatus Saelkia tenebricola]